MATRTKSTHFLSRCGSNAELLSNTPFCDSLLVHHQRVQVNAVENGYPGGIQAYVNNAKALLESSQVGANPFDGFKPEVRALFGSLLRSG